MIVVRCNSIKELERRGLPRTRKRPRHRWGPSPETAYLYLVFGESKYAKIGTTYCPDVRLPMVARFFKPLEGIYLVGPTDAYREIEASIVVALAKHAMKSPEHGLQSREWLDLPPLYYSLLQKCFKKGCPSSAIKSLARIASSPEPDYQI